MEQRDALTDYTPQAAFAPHLIGHILEKKGCHKLNLPALYPIDLGIIS